MTEDKPLQVRQMTAADLSFAVALKDLEGWNQLPADWERMLVWEPEGCFVAEWEGRPCGTTSTISYPGRFGWIGMVLVEEERRGRGIGRALMQAALDYLRPRAPCIRLDATPMGRPLYESLGFVAEYGLERRQVVAQALPAEGPEPLGAGLLEQVCAYDTEVFQADRSRVLRRLFAEEQVGKWALTEGGSLQGYAMIRPGLQAWYLGPVVAVSPQAAAQLIRAALGSVAGQPVYADAILGNAETDGLFSAAGFEPLRPLTRMYLGDNRWPGLTEQIYCPVGPEIG